MDDGVRKVKEFIVFILLMLFIIFFIGFVLCAILVTYEANPIISFVLGVFGGTIIGWVFSHFWLHNILEEQ